MKNDLTISIVAYRNYEDIRIAIKSIEEFTNEKILKKIYIVDNSCFCDEPEELTDFKRFVSQYCDVMYIDAGENLGFGRGHNYVLPQIQSRFHAIVNPDIELKEDAFSALIGYMDDHGDVGMCIPRIVDKNGELQKVYRKEVTVFDMFIRMFCKGMFKKRQAEHTLQNEDYSKPFQVPFGQGSFLLIRTELWKKIDGFDDRYFMYLEDADLCKRVNQVSKLMYCPDATVIHKWEKGSHKSRKLFLIHLKSMMLYFVKWGFR